MSKVFCVDVSKCNGCHNCQIACKDEHAGSDWLPYARAQPEIGQFWLKLHEHTQGSVPKVRMHYTPRLCNHCERAGCIAACPAGAISRRDDGLVLIDPQKCAGCGACKSACVYGAIFFNDELKIAQKCTGCAHLLDNGLGLPRCADACPTEALSFGEEAELEDFIVGAEVLQPETGFRPRVFYRNIPGVFIGGTVYDPEIEEVIIGARARCISGYKTWEATTDNYGDFWFFDLAPGVYEIIIGADGYEFQTFQRVQARESVNLGDIALERKADKQ
ncbi:MAG: 4Fe-4S dicluster domain-containing protein [Oscillospiraceae bacterium]|jgi:Fe-S-cluster-containing dehydrogenase component|nr:4Fe-4S dicluster domain-containing protein [Oscillospiraceae bacterium]